jgi:tetratricopeptide (TPR) repeat protein
MNQGLNLGLLIKINLSLLGVYLAALLVTKLTSFSPTWLLLVISVLWLLLLVSALMAVVLNLKIGREVKRRSQLIKKLTKGDREFKKHNFEEALKLYSDPELEAAKEIDTDIYSYSQDGIGSVYLQKYRQGKNHEDLKKAVLSLEEALHTRSPEDNQYNYALTLANLGTALNYLAKETSDQQKQKTYSKKALIAFNEALKQLQKSPDRLTQARVNNNLANAQLLLSKQEASPEKTFSEAISYYEKALDNLDAKKYPFYTAVTNYNLAIATRKLLDLRVSPELFTKYQKAKKDAKELFAQKGYKKHLKTVEMV